MNFNMNCCKNKNKMKFYPKANQYRVGSIKLQVFELKTITFPFKKMNITNTIKELKIAKFGRKCKSKLTINESTQII